MELYLIRHAEVAGDPHVCYQPPVDNCLTPRGCGQAEALAGRLNGVEFTAIYASPLGRAIQTAQPFAAGQEAPIQVLDWLKEWRPGTQLGMCDDAEFEELKRVAAKTRVEMSWNTGTGESTYELFGRIIPGFLGLMQAHGAEPAHGGYIMREPADAQRIALVAHNGTLRTIASHLMGIPIQPYPPFVFGHTGVAVFSFVQRVDVWYPALRVG